MTRFLGLEEVLALHADQIARYGGSAGVRDLGLLESAVAAAEATFGGPELHETVAEKAAAYLFHLAKNHPFVDGNKRVAAAAMFMFLYLNDELLDCSDDELAELTERVARSELAKPDVALFIRAHLAA